MNNKQDIINICKRLYQRNMLAAGDGNVSIRIGDEIVITPSGLPKAFITEADFAMLNMDGNIINGNPSTEKLMHLSVYQICPKAKAVIHAHAPHAIAWTLAKPELTELPTDALPEIILALGNIPIAKHAIPGTKALSDSITPLLPKHKAMILARHGVLAWGESLQEAMNGIERIEHVAEILLHAEKLGGAKALAQDKLTQLYELRGKIGDKTL